LSKGGTSPAVLAQLPSLGGALPEELLLGKRGGFAVLALTDLLEAALFAFAKVDSFAEAEPEGVVDEPVVFGGVFAAAPLGLDALLHVLQAVSLLVLTLEEAVGGKLLGAGPRGKEAHPPDEQDSGEASRKKS